jgi:protein-tyrosine-phosphatase
MGNVFRSRLAEAYLNSLHIKGIEVSSSGVRASHAFDGDISVFVLPLLKREGLESFISKTWVQTTSEIISDKDIVVFMNDEVLYFYKALFDTLPKKFEVWDVGDVSPYANSRPEIFQTVETAFTNIVKQVDQLVKNL